MKVVRSQWSVVSKSLFCFVAIALLFGLCHLAEAQQPKKVHRIGLLHSASAVDGASFIDAFRHGARELGYVEGKNLALEIRWGEAKRDRLYNLAAELVSLKVDVIVAVGSPALHAAAKATNTIPIVMRTGGDPVRAGVVASLAHPGGNITGVFARSVELSGKRLELIAEVVPGIKRISVLAASGAFKTTTEYKEMEAAARALKMHLQVFKAVDADTIDKAFVAMASERAEALVQIPHAYYVQHRERIINHVAKIRLPAIYSHNEDVEKGGLMSYGVNYDAEYRRTAFYVDKILKGAKPADLPVEQPKKFEFVVNLKTAQQIGLIIPPSVLARADRVIK